MRWCNYHRVFIPTCSESPDTFTHKLGCPPSSYDGVVCRIPRHDRNRGATKMMCSISNFSICLAVAQGSTLTRLIVGSTRTNRFYGTSGCVLEGRINGRYLIYNSSETSLQHLVLNWPWRSYRVTKPAKSFLLLPLASVHIVVSVFHSFKHEIANRHPMTAWHTALLTRDWQEVCWWIATRTGYMLWAACLRQGH